MEVPLSKQHNDIDNVLLKKRNNDNDNVDESSSSAWKKVRSQIGEYKLDIIRDKDCHQEIYKLGDDNECK